MGTKSKEDSKEERVEISRAWTVWDLESHRKAYSLKVALDPSITNIELTASI